tara:strand:+ start:32 stop:232 length:201 start_codon:yes stop_codon:yes gene_type:complete
MNEQLNDSLKIVFGIVEGSQASGLIKSTAQASQANQAMGVILNALNIGLNEEGEFEEVETIPELKE